MALFLCRSVPSFRFFRVDFRSSFRSCVGPFAGFVVWFLSFVLSLRGWLDWLVGWISFWLVGWWLLSCCALVRWLASFVRSFFLPVCRARYVFGGVVGWFVG